MRAVVLEAPGTVRTADVAEPDRTGLAIVAAEQIGICGTDVKIFKGAIPVAYPRIPGHELIGRVLEPGPLGLVPRGTRVLVDPSRACGVCRMCRDHRPHICLNGALMGRDEDGVFAERIAVAEDRLHPVPEDVTPEAAALLQVLGTCVHAQFEVEVRPPDAAVVVGLGVAGLLHVQLLRARGIRRVIAVTRSEAKRDLATRFGAIAALAPGEAEDAVRDLTGGEGAPLVIEAAGVRATLVQAISLAAVGGTLLAFGTITGTEGDAIPLYELYRKELRWLNPRAATPGDYDRGIALTAAGDLDLAPLWDRAHPFEAAAEAFADAADGAVLKVTLDV